MANDTRESSKVIPEENKNGSGDSLYINTTGKHNRNEIVSISRIVASILMMINGLISFIEGI
jgi:hypothetical protein